MLFCLILLIIVNVSIFSEDIENNLEEKDRKWTIQTSPAFLLSYIYLEVLADDVFVIDLEGQYKINDLFNISLTFSCLISFYSKGTRNQIHIKPMFIYRPLKTGLKGFYIGLYPIFGWLGFNEQYYEVFLEDGRMEMISVGPSKEIGMGLDIGYKWIFRNGFSLQLGGGIGKTWEIPSDLVFGEPIRSDGRVSFDKFALSFDIKFGYSF